MPSSRPPTEVLGWVIEIEGPKYWTSRRDEMWSYDVARAVRFMRKQDAENVRYWVLSLTETQAKSTELVN